MIITDLFIKPPVFGTNFVHSGRGSPRTILHNKETIVRGLYLSFVIGDESYSYSSIQQEKISLFSSLPDFDQERGNIKCATSGVGNVKDFVDTAQALSGNRNQACGDRLIRTSVKNG
jgi:hypothetical protein